MTETDSVMDRVEQSFPAESFREHQKDTIAKMVMGFEDHDCDVILLDAPTGAGKSLILDTTADSLELTDIDEGSGFSTDFDTPYGSGDSDIPDPLGQGTFFTTPLNSLVDQIDDDGLISPRVMTLKGRNNYSCIHPEDEGTRVDEAICQRDDSFECDMKGDCPYYGRKYDSLTHERVVTSMSYLMAEGMIPGTVKGTFADRDLLIVDECQKLEDFAMNFISFTVSRRTVPDEVWSNITVPHGRNQGWANGDEHVENSMDFLKAWLKDEVLDATRQMAEYLDGSGLMSKAQSKEKEKLEQFEIRVENFLDDIEDNDWIAQIDKDVNKNAPNTKKIVFKPIEVGRFLDSLLWSRADKVILSSATIPRGGWLSEMGLGDESIGRVSVPSTFPVDNRPIITSEAVGKMTYAEREDNAWPMSKKIKEIAGHHDGKGMVHCRSYGIMEMLKRAFINHQEGEWFRDNCMLQDKERREESLEEWQESDKQVFFSVAMDEGVSLDGDSCRWQVLAKTLYKSMSDKRVKYRVQNRNEWDWYNRHAAIQIAQAYGRAVRGPDDWAYFYILDKSAVGLIERNEHLFPDWFLEAVDA